MIQQLREFYGLQPTPPSDIFQFAVWEVLSQRALPARRDLAWHALRRLAALTPDALWRTPGKDLLDAVRIAGPQSENKVELLRSMAATFKRHRETLAPEHLKRVGMRKALGALGLIEQLSHDARLRALLFALDYPVLAVDGDVHRVVGRLRGRPLDRARARSRRWLDARIERTAARDAILYLGHHAQHTCTPVAPHCAVCPLRGQCVYVRELVERRDATP